MPVKRGAAVAATVGDKMYVIGGVTTQPWAKENYLDFTTHSVASHGARVRSEDQHWRERTAMPTPRNHAAIGVVNGRST
jgi:hypothetical protein